MPKKPSVGSGKPVEKLEQPAALAASVVRKKYGEKKKASAGRKKK